MISSFRDIGWLWPAAPWLPVRSIAGAGQLTRDQQKLSRRKRLWSAQPHPIRFHSIGQPEEAVF